MRWGSVEESMEAAGNIFVSVRIRPLNEKEAARNEEVDWECSNDKSIIHKNNAFSPDRSMYPSSYSFDKVFGPNCSTRQVYQEGAKEIALSVVGGVNSSVFAYGQTSSGKTHTMTGITEYAVADIFDHIHKHTEREFVMRFSAMEIYNESVRDLLSVDATPLRLLDDPERGTVVDKLTEEVVRDSNHLAKLLSVCKAQRQVAETLKNESSSRSHQIIKLTVESHAREVSVKDRLNALSATVNFIDLGGSERASQGCCLKEALYINHSLITLEAVIYKLSKRRNELIPYRESKLTRILQSFLGSNTRTAIICTIIPARSYTEQSRNTLLFATSAKQVRTSAKINLQLSEKASAKHAHIKLARLENELTNAESALRTDSVTLDKEKELLIHKLERQVMELMLQRDLALSRVKDVQMEVEGKKSPVQEPGNLPYPKLLVRRQSWASSQTNSQGSPAAKLHSVSSDPAPLRTTSHCCCCCCGENSTSSDFEFSYDESPRLFIRSLVDQEDEEFGIEENRPLKAADENSGSLPSLQPDQLSGKSMIKEATEVPSTKENAVILYKNSMKNMKHFGVQHDLISQQWPSDFDRLRRDVISLWDACNVSLLYRTSFFLLFAGDTEDAIYMEVERRRLSFVKDAFAWGKETVLDGQIISPSLSNKHMQQERQMLSKMMKSRISKDEREILYIKWGIDLDTKKRRSQLLGHVWTKPKDMDHVQESAAVVSMLIRFDKSRVRKEMFGINLMPALKGIVSHAWLHTASVRFSP